jgi:hypothetical protein
MIFSTGDRTNINSRFDMSSILSIMSVTPFAAIRAYSFVVISSAVEPLIDLAEKHSDECRYHGSSAPGKLQFRAPLPESSWDRCHDDPAALWHGLRRPRFAPCAGIRSTSTARCSTSAGSVQDFIPRPFQDR